MTKPVSGRKPVLALLMRLLCAAALALPVFGAQAGVVFSSLHSFQQPFPNGANPRAGLVQGSDGSFYGTTERGGTGGGGTVFRITANGVLTSLYSFTGGNDGANPEAALVQASDRNSYGTTVGGGTDNYGTVFRISPSGVLTSLYSFTGGNDGGYHQAGLVQGSDGSLYGTTFYGGTNGLGTVFKIAANGALTSLYSFTGGTDGAKPQAGLVQGSDGNLYGTASGGDYYGAIFRITTNGAFTLIHSFTGADDGAYPEAALIQASDGDLYGTASAGGINGLGTVFRVSVNGDFNSLFSFNDTDGSTPVAALFQADDGYLYGTTTSGTGRTSSGTIFRISTNGAFDSLHLFTGGNDGGEPNASLMQASDGSLYGTTAEGGTNGAGTVFRTSTNGALTSLYSFTASVNDGATPQAGLVQGSDGSLYGTTACGGAGASHGGFLPGGGTVFKISTNGALTSLYLFTGGNDGEYPYAGLVQGSDGNLYGTTAYGGIYGELGTVDDDSAGTVFKISTNGALTTLYLFGTIQDGNGDALDGENPYAGLVRGSDGYFYGTTRGGGSYGPYGGGTVFKISTNGELTSLYSFPAVNYANDGVDPYAELVQGIDGYFYGTTKYGGTGGVAYGGGTVFKISTNGAHTSLYSFTGGNDGEYPYAGLVQDSDGSFYGTTEYGGTNGYGTVFKISAKGAYTHLYSFGGNDGANPEAALVQGSDGYFYGTTRGGGSYGPYGGGTVFRISTIGALTTLYSFTGGNDGAQPFAGLVQGSDGNFYGTTAYGGQGGAGTVFKLTVVPEFQTMSLTNHTLSLTWSTEAGGTYQLQYNSDLTSSNWTNLGSVITAAGATLITTDSVTNASRRFYRVVLWP
jgi:uncharacterized repeat protein (TIGR03803 family)